MRRFYFRKMRRTFHLRRLLWILPVVLLFWLDAAIRPVLRTALQTQTKLLATDLISQEVSRVLADENIRYDTLVSTVRNEAGDILAIQTDAQAVNRFKIAMTAGLNQAIRQLTDRPYAIRLGTLLGSKWMMGRGPAISFRLTPVGFVECDLHSEFVSAGVNQTCHRLMLQTRLELSALVPTTAAKSQVSTEFVVAETVIVGQVPRYISQTG